MRNNALVIGLLLVIIIIADPTDKNANEKNKTVSKSNFILSVISKVVQYRIYKINL